MSAALLSLLAATGVSHAEIVSEYSQLDLENGCSVFDAAEGGEGDGANMVCAGYRGYPVMLFYSDLRQSMFYGFAPDGDLAWESFGAFNHTAATIEWRIERNGDVETPFATIHRWFVSQPDDDNRTEVLAVSKAGQLGEREGCTVAYVVSTGNTDANEKARRIAD